MVTRALLAASAACLAAGCLVLPSDVAYRCEPDGGCVSAELRCWSDGYCRAGTEPTDAGALDAGGDAGAVDAGSDAGAPDAGPSDAGAPDAGSDAGVDGGTDGGTDAGRDAGFDAGFDAGSCDAGSARCGLFTCGVVGDVCGAPTNCGQCAMQSVCRDFTCEPLSGCQPNMWCPDAPSTGADYGCLAVDITGDFVMLGVRRPSAPNGNLRVYWRMPDAGWLHQFVFVPDAGGFTTCHSPAAFDFAFAGVDQARTVASFSTAAPFNRLPTPGAVNSIWGLDLQTAFLVQRGVDGVTRLAGSLAGPTMTLFPVASDAGALAAVAGFSATDVLAFGDRGRFVRGVRADGGTALARLEEQAPLGSEDLLAAAASNAFDLRQVAAVGKRGTAWVIGLAQSPVDVSLDASVDLVAVAVSPGGEVWALGNGDAGQSIWRHDGRWQQVPEPMVATTLSAIQVAATDGGLTVWVAGTNGVALRRFVPDAG